MCLWDGHLPSSPHTQGVRLRTGAKAEFIPISWKFSWIKMHSCVNRLCSLCSSFRGGSRAETEGEWPQVWGIPLFCLEQCEAGSPNLPLHSKCPTPAPNLDARDTSQFLAEECWQWKHLPSATLYRKVGMTTLVPLLYVLKKLQRYHMSITSAFIKLNKWCLKQKVFINFSSGKHWNISDTECAGGPV